MCECVSVCVFKREGGWLGGGVQDGSIISPDETLTDGETKRTKVMGQKI